MMAANLFESVWTTKYQPLIPEWKLVKADLEPNVTADCCRGLKTISIAATVFETNRKIDIERILAHEVAHALVGDEQCDTHSGSWKRKCIELGGSGRLHEHIAKTNHNLLTNRCCELYQDTLSIETEITNAVEIQIQKLAIDQLLAEGVDATVLLQMYVDSRDQWK